MGVSVIQMDRTVGPTGSMKLGTPEVPRQRVCIALPARGHDYDEMGHILSQVVRELGLDVRVARDAEPSLLDCDALILFGKCSAFTQSARLLEAHAARRPATILWHIEPLLPEPVPQAAQRTCRMLAGCDWSEWPWPMSEIVARIPGSGLVRGAARDLLSARLTRRCGWDSQPRYAQVHPRQWSHAAQHHAWLWRRHNDRWCDLVAVSTIPRHRVLTEMGIRCAYAPLGYHPGWGTDLGLARDIDVLFLGRVRRTSRRTVLARVGDRLRHHGLRLTVVDRDCFGQDRTELLNRTRIVLDLVQCPWDMPVMRLLTSMACGAMVISDWPGDPHPFSRDHLVQVEATALADTAVHYLEAESERQRIAHAGRQYVVKQLTWHETVRRVLRLCRQDITTVKGVVV